MDIIKNWFTNNNGQLEYIVASEDNYVHRIIKHDRKDKLTPELVVGINLPLSNHYITPVIVHEDDTHITYVMSYYNGINLFSAEDEFIYNQEMLEAHHDAVKAGFTPVFDFEDVTTNERDEIVVVNLNKFKI